MQLGLKRETLGKVWVLEKAAFMWWHIKRLERPLAGVS